MLDYSLEKDFKIFTLSKELPITTYPSYIRLGIVIYCVKGNAKIDIYSNKHIITPKELIIILPGQLVALTDVSVDFQIRYFTITESFYSDILSGISRLSPHFFLYMREHYYLNMEDVDCDIIPVGCVLTMVGTGSEMNGGAVITNHEQKLKIGHVFGENVFPKFSILDPTYTYTLPKYQMISGIYDIFNHICEQYFSGEDDSASDYISEGLMRSVVHSSYIALKDSKNYEARSNIMWTATWALNTLIAKGKTTDWMVHMLGQAVGAYTDATHGMTLSAVSMAYYRHICPYGLEKFVRFAINVWNITPDGKTQEQIAEEGLSAMETWMKELGLVMNIKELGVNENMLNGLADSTIFLMMKF